jgi:twinkle protein
MSLNIPNTIDFRKYLEGISYLESQMVRGVADFQDELDAFYDNPEKEHGIYLPWEGLRNIIRLAPGELTVWGGESSSGKSQITGQVILWNLMQEKAVIASMEMKPRDTIKRMACQAAGCAASRAFENKLVQWASGRLWIYDQLDSVAAEKILGMVHWCVRELGITQIVIDSLTKCGLPRDDYTAQAKFVDRLQWAAKHYNCHIHLVCHMRKPAAGHKSGKHDIRGAAEITDLADNVIVVSRNKNKEDFLESAKYGGVSEADIEKNQNQPDTVIAIAKNRKTGEEKPFSLWFNKDANQFTSDSNRRPMYFKMKDASDE